MSGYSFAAGFSVLENVHAAARALCDQLTAGLSGPPNLVVFFGTDDYIEPFEAVCKIFVREFPQASLVGMTAESVLAGNTELEQPPALAAWGACLPDAVVRPFQLEFAQTPEGDAFLGWPDDLADQAWQPQDKLMLLADPFSFPADVFLANLAQQHPGAQVFGGMASAAHAPRGNRLCLNGECFDSGGVAVHFSGSACIDIHVSQGCRPIGSPFVVTKASSNVIFELGGKKALDQLNDLIVSLSEEDRRLVGQGLHLGIAMSEYKETFGRGDFLIRNVMGVEKKQGAVVVGDFPRTGQTVQFHVRDAASAHEDLEHVLPSSTGQAVGALVFTCNGRGVRLFGEPHHDAFTVSKKLGSSAIAGCFCAGEIGPVSGKNFLHGFTASTAIFKGPQ